MDQMQVDNNGDLKRARNPFMEFNPFNDIMNVMMNNIRAFEGENDNWDDINELEGDDDEYEYEEEENNVPVNLFIKNQQKLKKMRIVEIKISGENTQETITTINEDGSEEVEIHNHFKDKSKDTVETLIKPSSNLNKSRESPLKLINSIDGIMDDFLLNLLFGGHSLGNRINEFEDDENEYYEEDDFEHEHENDHDHDNTITLNGKEININQITSDDLKLTETQVKLDNSNNNNKSINKDNQSKSKKKSADKKSNNNDLTADNYKNDKDSFKDKIKNKFTSTHENIK